MSEVNIDSIRIEAKTNIKEAISDIEALKQSLTGLGDNKSGIDRYSTSVNGLTQRLTRLTGITNKTGIAAVEKSVRELAEASIKLNNLQLNEKKGSIFSEDTWKRAMGNVESAMENVKNTIAQNVKEIRQLDGVEKAFDNYIKKARNIKIPIGVKNDLNTDREFANLRSVLGKNFSTTNSGTDFVAFIDDMNKSINTTFDTTKNATDLFKDVVERLRDIRKEAVMTSQDVIKNGLIPVQEIESELSKFAAKDIPNLSEKYGITENDVYGGKKLSENSGTESVKEVTSAIGQKTRAFEKEQQTVTDVVNSEMKDLINLRSTIESVTNAVGDGKGLAGAFKGLKELGLGELASLKNIDFSGIAKLNIKALQETIKQTTNIKNSASKTIGELAHDSVLKYALGSSSPEHLIAKTTAKGNEINIPTKLSEIQSLYQKLINYKGELIRSISETWNNNNENLDVAIDKILKYREQLAQTRSSIKQVGEVLEAVRNGTDITKGEQWLAEYNSFLGDMQEYRTKILQESLEMLQTEQKNSPKLNLMESLSDLGTATDSVEQKLSELFDMLQSLPSSTDRVGSQARTMIVQSAQQLGIATESIENALSTLHGTLREYSTASETSAPIDDLNNHVNLVEQSLSALDSVLQLTQNEVRAFAQTGQLSETALQALSNASQTSDMVIDHMSSSISELTGNLGFYRQSLEQASQEPPIFRDTPEDINRLNRNMQKLPLSLSQLKSDISDLAGIMGGFVGKAISVAGAIGKIGSFATKVNKQILSFTKDFAKLSWEFLNFGSSKNALSGLKSPFGQSSASLGDFNKKLKHGITTVLRYGFGIRSLYVLFNKLRSGIKDGINNLVMFSDRANKSLSLLTSDMSYVGNSVAAAFEPILNIVAPIIDQIVDYAVAGINAVGAFIASITGQTSYTVAVKNIKDYRDSLNGTASAGDAASDATDKLKDKTDELKRELMGFDEIEKFSEDLDNAANSGSGSGSGSGNGSGTEDPILFTKKDIPGAVSNFADLVKDAWAKADFTDIGKMVGTKLRDALDSIDWEPIKEQANKIAKVTGTFINGFFETEGLDKSVGRTLGEAVNTAVGAINTFVDTTHWTSIGEFMSGGLRSAITTIDWDGLGKTLNAKYKALWSFLDGFVVDMSKINFSGTTGWQEAGNALASTINSIFADRDYTKTGQTIAAGINGITSALTTGIAGIDFNSISRNFANGINSVFYNVDWQAIGTMLSDGMNAATSSLLTFSVTVDWKRIGSELASSANTFLAKTDFSQAGKALGQAFKGALSAINELAATFNWRSLGIDINNFIKGINWMGILKTSANVVANTFFGLFETAWAAVFGGPDTKYTAIADNLNKALSKLKIEWPAMEQEEIEKFENVSIIVDKFLELNEKLKKNGSLSETDMSLFKTYYDQIVEYAPQAAKLIGEVGTAYEGTDQALKALIASQKNAAIAEGFKTAMSDAAKVMAESAIALNGAVDDLVSSVITNKDSVFSKWNELMGGNGTMAEMTKTMDSLFKKMREGKYDVDSLQGSEAVLAHVIGLTSNSLQEKMKNVDRLTTTLNESETELDKMSEASTRYSAEIDTASIKTESFSTKLGNIKFTGVWKSLKDELKNTLDGVTETLKRDDFTLGISNTLTNMFDKEFRVNLKAGSLDTSEIPEKQKTVGGVCAGIVKASNQIPESIRKLDFVGAITSKKDEIADRKISNLEGSVSKVSQTGGLTLDNLGGWIGYIGSKVSNLTLDNIGAWINYIGSQKSNMTLSDIGAWISYIGSQKDYMTLSDIGAWISYIGSQKSNMTLNDIGAWISFIGSQISGMTLSGIGAWISNVAAQSGGLTLSDIGAWISYIAKSGDLSLSGINGLVNQVEKQPGSSLILKGIHGIVSSITNILGGKAEGGAFYGGKWHSIPQFSSGGVITKDFVSSFSAIPRYAGGTVNAGSMFIAGEAGPELVGHVGGRTEVLNESQLASVMQSAVAEGMQAAMSQMGGGGNVTVNVTLQGDARRIFEVVKNENNSRVMQTGKAQLLT